MRQFVVIIKKDKKFVSESIEFLEKLGLEMKAKIGILNDNFVVFLAEPVDFDYFNKIKKFSFDKDLFVALIDD